MARLLDLFCGPGGGADGYTRAGFEVVGVDVVDQPSYPYEFHRFDALDFLNIHPAVLRNEFDVVHASPPCQLYSAMHGSSGPDLIGPVRRALLDLGLPYVIENVPGAPLMAPIELCGSMFDLDVKRHRLFEASWPLPEHHWPCRHGIWSPRFPVQDHGKTYLSKTVPVYGTGGGKASEHWARAMGITRPMSRAEMSQAIPPDYTAWIGARWLEWLNRSGVGTTRKGARVSP